MSFPKDLKHNNTVSCAMCKQDLTPVRMPKNLPNLYRKLQYLHTYYPVYVETDGTLEDRSSVNYSLIYNMHNGRSYTESSPNMLEYRQKCKTAIVIVIEPASL